jgi:hypothetical protein
VDVDLPQVILGWLLNWCNCPDRGLSAAQRAQAAAARGAAADRASVLAASTKEDLSAALDQALAGFPALCPDVAEERRLRMVARLARVLEGDRLPGALINPPDAAPKIG